MSNLTLLIERVALDYSFELGAGSSIVRLVNRLDREASTARLTSG
jgi:hypothetical protein